MRKEKISAVAQKKQHTKIIWGAAAVCLCLIAAGVFVLLRAYQTKLHRQPLSAADYFRFCDPDEADVLIQPHRLDPTALPSENAWVEVRNFSDLRGELEQNGVIPAMETHPQFGLCSRFNPVTGSLICVYLSWHRESPNGLEGYSSLLVVAGSEELPIVTDCIDVAVDDNGNATEPGVTVTERDGVQIVARGRENTFKTLSFRRGGRWYQVSGSPKDGYEDIVRLLDWFWEHPLDVTAFPMDAGEPVAY